MGNRYNKAKLFTETLPYMLQQEALPFTGCHMKIILDTLSSEHYDDTFGINLKSI